MPSVRITGGSGRQSSCRAFPTFRKSGGGFYRLALESVIPGAENSDGFSGRPDASVGGKRLNKNNFTVVL